MQSNPSKPFRMLSFDVGIKHLSYVDISHEREEENVISRERAEGSEGSEGSDAPQTDRRGAEKTSTAMATKIKGWGVIDVTEGCERPDRVMRDVDALATSTIRKLQERFFEHDASAHYDWVIIENQPVIKNPTMKTMQIMLYTFFQTVRCVFGAVSNVRFVSASLKLGAVDKTAPKLSYAEKKKRGIEMCRAKLAECPALTKDTEFTQIFENSKKKDDLADAFLQAMAFMQRN